MTEQIIEAALSQGIWTALSFILLFYIIRAQEKEMRNKTNVKRNIKTC